MATSDVSRLYKAVEAINDRLAARFPAVRPEMTISGRIFPHRPYGVMFFTAPTAPWFALQNFLKFNPLASSHVFITVATPPSLFRQCPVMQITVEIPPLPNIAGHSPLVLRASCATQRQEGEHSIYEPSRHQVEAILRDLDICVFRVLILLGLILPGDTIELETDGHRGTLKELGFVEIANQRLQFDLHRLQFRQQEVWLRGIIDTQLPLPAPTASTTPASLPRVDTPRLLDKIKNDYSATRRELKAVDRLLGKYRATAFSKTGIKLKFEHTKEVQRDKKLLVAALQGRLTTYPLLRLEVFQQTEPSAPAAANLLDLPPLELSCRLHDILCNSETVSHHIALMYYKTAHEKRPLFDIEFRAKEETNNHYCDVKHELLRPRHKVNIATSDQPVNMVDHDVMQDFAFICKQANNALMEFAACTEVAEVAKVVEVALGSKVGAI